MTLMSNEIRDQLIKETLYDPLSNSSLVNWAQNSIHSDIIGFFPLNCKQHKNDIIDENVEINDNIEFDEYSFSKNEIAYKFNEKLTLTGHLSFVELFLFQAKFWTSNSTRIYSDSFAVLQ